MSQLSILYEKEKKMVGAKEKKKRKSCNVVFCLWNGSFVLYYLELFEAVLITVNLENQENRELFLTESLCFQREKAVFHA